MQWLINVNALKDSFCEACSTKTRYKRTIEECRVYMNKRGDRCFKMRLINNAPAIDAEPVRHGYWLPKKIGAVTTEFECSECGRTVTRANDYFGKATKYASSYYPYCHCGAKMDLEVQDD